MTVLSRIHQHRIHLYRPENSSSTINTFVYIPTEFNENEAYISDLLRHNGYVAAILSEEFAVETLFQSPTFSCTCGRPQVSGKNNLSPDLYQPILLTSDNTKAAQLCMNTTYLPNKKQIKTSAVFVNLTSSYGDFSGKLDPVIEKSDKNVMKFTYLSTVFDTVFLPSSPLPFDSDSDHKTVFHACAFIQVVLNRMFVIARYPKFCFDAHRGAAGDADQASNNKMFNMDVLINPSNPSADYSLASTNNAKDVNDSATPSEISSITYPAGTLFSPMNTMTAVMSTGTGMGGCSALLVPLVAGSHGTTLLPSNMTPVSSHLSVVADHSVLMNTNTTPLTSSSINFVPSSGSNSVTNSTIVHNTPVEMKPEPLDCFGRVTTGAAEDLLTSGSQNEINAFKLHELVEGIITSNSTDGNNPVPTETIISSNSKASTGSGPYRCRECDKEFRILRYLEKHRRIHTGEKPYQCCYCGRQFNDWPNMNRHKRIHT
ncbi:uncharacterized protein DC041_0009255, partial [Schistosoma bovis]